MPTSVIKIGKYNNGRGTLEGQVKKNLVEWSLQAQMDISDLVLEKSTMQEANKELRVKNNTLAKLNKQYSQNQSWLDNVDLGDFDSFEEYFLNLKAKDNGIDVLSGQDYNSLLEEHEKLKSLYMKLILN